MATALSVVTCETTAQCLRVDHYLEALVTELVFVTIIVVVIATVVWNAWHLYGRRLT